MVAIQLDPYTAALRDTLLPRLLSGELRVADAEQAFTKLSVENG